MASPTLKRERTGFLGTTLPTSEPSTSLTRAIDLITTLTDLQYSVLRGVTEGPSSEHKTEEIADAGPARVNEGNDKLEQASYLELRR